MLPVAVEIAPPDAPREHVTVLLSACTRAKRGSECVLAAEVPTPGSSAVAIVTWQGTSRALVEVGLRREGRPEWRTRTLDFDPARDDALERWRAVGLVIGTLANEEIEAQARRAEALATKTEPQPAKNPEAPGRKPVARARDGTDKAGELGNTPSTIESTSAADATEFVASARLGPVRGRLDIGAAAGPALESVRFGGLVRGELRLPDPLRLQVTARYLEHPRGDRELRAQWITGSVGVGVGAASEHAEVTIALDGRGEYFAARAERGSEAEAATRWLTGLGVGASAAWMPSGTLGLFAGGDVSMMFGSTDVRVEDRDFATDSSFRYAAEGGVRFRLR